MKVAVRQYLRPYGRPRDMTTEVPESAEALRGYDELAAGGCRLTAEVLMTGQASLTIEDLGREFDDSIRVVENGPAVPEAIVELLSAFRADQANSRRAELLAESQKT